MAKLAAICKQNDFMNSSPDERKIYFKNYSIDRYIYNSTNIHWTDSNLTFSMGDDFGRDSSKAPTPKNRKLLNESIIDELAHNENFMSLIEKYSAVRSNNTSSHKLADDIAREITKYFTANRRQNHIYVPTERTFVPSIEYSWAGILRDDIGLPKIILEFANLFNSNKNKIGELNVDFLNIKYIHQNGNDYIKSPHSETLFRLFETASGIQSVVPLLVLLEYLSFKSENIHSFIVEEPELNIFPLAQFELVKILIDKCARIESSDDLIITTHSPYVLTALNLMCYAFSIAQKDAATAKKVSKLIPRNCWINPEQFAAYYVDLPSTKKKQQVRSIINKKTGLIEENELDTASLELSEIFNKLVRLRQPTKSVTRAK